jgi:hypothetical protein
MPSTTPGTVTTNADGTVVVMNPDGTTTVMNPDGTMTVTNPDGTMTTVPAGSGTATPMATAPGAGTDTPATPGEPGTLPSECVQGIPATSQVPRLLNREYDNIVRDLLGMTTLANGQPPSSLLNADYEGPMDAIIWNAYQGAAAAIASEVIGGDLKANFISCDPAAVATCYEDTIRAFGRKAFRRPLTDEDVARFMALTTITPAGTADEIAEALLYGFLVSPSFIMVPEMASTAEGSGIKLSSHEVATRISLAVWGSIPDQELSDAADADMLQDSAQILAHAERMLQNREKAGQQVALAHRNYLVMDDQSHWFKISHDSALFPNYADSYRESMRAELDAFFQEIAFNGGSFRDLFLSTAGFVNNETAALYGLDPSAYGPELTKVDLPTRPGFLTRLGFLSSFSADTVTSPILRGAFITVQLLGVNPGTPDPDALKRPIPDGEYTTRRQQIEALTQPAECTGCHTPLVNPPGFVLENFNAVGEWQDTDPLGGPIDATASVIFNGSNTKTITSPLEMMTEIANTPEAIRVYAERLVAFATRRFPNPQDACIVESVGDKLTNQPGYTVLNLLADVTQADSFRLRTVGN